MKKKFYGEIFMEQENLKLNGIYYPIKIDYYKTEETNEILKIRKYGIEIVKTEYKDEKINVETNNINEISNEEEQIDNILKIFKQNEVTPIIAEDILEDYLLQHKN